MAHIKLEKNEQVITKEKAQWAKGFPQTVGDLFLTDQRVVLIPNQLLSIGFGKHLDFRIADVEEVRSLSRLEGGTFAGSLGQKILIRTKDSQAYTFSFALSKGAETFHTEINKLLGPAHSKDKQLSELEKIENKLVELKKLFDEGVIKEQDYEISRKELVDRL